MILPLIGMARGLPPLHQIGPVKYLGSLATPGNNSQKSSQKLDPSGKSNGQDHNSDSSLPPSPSTKLSISTKKKIKNGPINLKSIKANKPKTLNLHHGKKWDSF